MLSLLDKFNLIDRITGRITALRRGDYKRARKHGKLAVLWEFLRSATGTNTRALRVRRDSGWTGASVEKMLKAKGVRLWGRRVTSEHFIFTVEKRQAAWADYLIARTPGGQTGRSGQKAGAPSRTPRSR
jgi:hypothetical protein